MFAQPEASEARALEEADLERRFGEYWKHVDYWDGQRLYRSVIACGKMLLEMGSNPEVSPQPNRVGAIKAAGEMFYRLLNKHMPDLKAVEVSGHVGMTHEEALDQLEQGIVAAETSLGELSLVRGDLPTNTH